MTRKVEDVWPLSPLQEGLLFHALLDDEDVYTVHLAFDLDGPLDAADLKSAAQALLDRHPNLRVAFRPHQEGLDQPVQVVLRDIAVPWKEVDLSRQTGTEARAVAEADRGVRFDTATAPLLRFTLLRFGDTRHRLLLTCHHILLDGWSMPLLMRELLGLYRGDTLPEPASYRGYLAWLARRDKQAARDAWRHALAGIEEPTHVAAGGAADGKPATSTMTSVTLDRADSDALRERARAHGLTLNSLLQGAWASVLSRVTGRTDVVFGNTVAGRPPELPGVEDMVGMFINTVPVRTCVQPSLIDTAKALQRDQAALLDHQHLGLIEIQRLAGVGTLFDTLYVYENYPHATDDVTGAATVRGVAASQVDGRGAVHYPMTLAVVPGDEIALTLSCRPDLVDTRALDRFVLALKGDDLLPEERSALARWNDTDTEVGVGDRTLTELVQEQVRRTPDNRAVTFDGRHLTYRGLDEAAESVANRLRGRGVGPESVVGVRMERSLDLPVALLGVLKAGAAYLPLDVDLPAERSAYMLEDSGAAFVLERLERLETAETSAGPRDVRPRPDNAFNVIYTSGSTGRPKGVVSTHRGVVNQLLWMQRTFRLSADDAVLQKTPTSFDVSAWELFWPLIAGARMVLAAPGGQRDPDHIRDLVEREGVTVLQFVPSMLAAFVAEVGEVANLRLVISAGEALGGPTVRAARATLPGAHIHNLYGPTEAAIAVTGWPVADGVEPVPIGAPVANTRIHVLDANLRPTPPGVPGQVHVAGPQVARAYHRRPGQTAKAFVPDPYGPAGSRLYATGDMATWDGDGQLLYLGRRDHQVKLHGQRIELDEITAALRDLPGVADAATVLRDNHIVGYLVAQAAPDTSALDGRLPVHMRPTSYVRLDRLPTTPHGKLDRAALPAPEVEASTVEPETPTERTVAGIYEQLLHGTVGAEDDFFQRGGDSIHAIQLVARLRKAGLDPDRRVGVTDVLRHPTVRALARRLDAPHDTAHGLLVKLRSSPRERRSLVCVPYGAGPAAVFQPLADALPDGDALYAVGIPGHDPAVTEEPMPFHELAERCATEILLTVAGPVVLYGHCGVGSILTIELARRLEAAGRTVEAVHLAAYFPIAHPRGALGWVQSWLDRTERNRSVANWMRSMGVALDELDPDQADRVLTTMRRDGRVATEYMTGLLESKPEKLRAPIISIIGDRDPATDYYTERYREWSFLSDTVELVVLREAGHFFLKHRAGDLAEILTGAPGKAPQNARWTRGHGTGDRGSEQTRVEPSTKRFLAVAVSQLIATTGAALTAWAIPVWIYTRTGSLGWLGLSGVVAIIPMLLAMPVAGVVADRDNRRRVIMAATGMEAVVGVALAAVVSTSGSPLPYVYAAMVLLIVAGAFQRITFTASIAQLAPKRYLGSANGIAQILNGVTLLLAPPLAAALFAVIGLAGILVVEVVGGIVAIAVLAAVRFPDLLGSRRKEPYLTQLLGGLRLVWNTKPLRAMLVFAAVANLLYSPAVLLVTPLVLSFDDLAAVGRVGLAEGLGAVAGGLAMAVWGGPRKRRQVAAMLALGVIGVAMAIAGLRPDLRFVLAGFFVSALALGLGNGIYLTIMQVKIPQRFHGRVIALNQTISWSTIPLAFAVLVPASGALDPLLMPGGALADSVGAVIGSGPGRGIALAYLFFGAALVAATVIGLRIKTLARLDTELPDAVPDDLVGVASLAELDPPDDTGGEPGDGQPSHGSRSDRRGPVTARRDTRLRIPGHV